MKILYMISIIAFLALICAILIKMTERNSEKLSVRIKTYVYALTRHIRFGTEKKASGFVFGRASPFHLAYCTLPEYNAFIVGGAGSGKTSAVAIPLIRSYPGTIFCVDIAGDISSNAGRGDMIIYNPENPVNNVKFDVFHLIDQMTDENQIRSELAQLALLIMPDMGEKGSAGNYFTSTARDFLTAGLIGFYFAGLDFAEIMKKIFNSGYLDFMQEVANLKNDYAAAYIKGYECENEKNVSGAYNALKKQIQLFVSDFYVYHSLGRPKEASTMQEEIIFTPQLLESKSLFFRVSEAKLDYYSPLLRMIVLQSFDYFKRRSEGCGNNILYLLDELPAFRHIPNLDNALQVLRKRNINIVLCTQTMAALEIHYDHYEIMAILGNCNYQLVMSARTVEEQKYWCDLAGQRKVHDTIENISRIAWEPKIRPEEFNSMIDIVVFYPGGYFRVNKNFYFYNRKDFIFQFFHLVK